MGNDLLALLAVDENDPQVASGQAVAAELADLIESLVRARRDCGITQQDIAEAMETTQSVISNFERIGGDPKFSTIARYAHAIGGQLNARIVFDGASGAYPLVSEAADNSETANPLIEQQHITTPSPLLQV